MNTLELTLLIWLGSLAAGFLGALTGLGGGVVLVPLLTLVFGIHMHYAIGASLISVMATSCAAAAAYLKTGYANIRIGMFLEIATTLGAIGGAFLAVLIPTAVTAIIFGLVLLLSAVLSVTTKEITTASCAPDRLAQFFQFNGQYPTQLGLQSYHPRLVPLGFLLMAVAGMLSGLLGIGSGALNVLAMDQAMRIPFKVSTTTSNFMIGVTAAASAGVYLKRGFIDPGLAMPVMLGGLCGAYLGTHVLLRAKTKVLRLIFSIVLFAVALYMIYNGIGKL